jgi:hypothetical protein
MSLVFEVYKAERREIMGKRETEKRERKISVVSLLML